MVAVSAWSHAQAPAGDLRQQVLLRLSTFEAPADPAAHWAGLPAGAADVLRDVAADPERAPHLRLGALGALRYFPDPGVTAFLVAVATDPREDLPRRTVAAISLAHLGSATARAALQDLAAGDAAAREVAIEGLGYLADRAAWDLLEDLLAAASDGGERLRLHQARARWLARHHGDAAPAVQVRVRRVQAPDAPGGGWATEEVQAGLTGGEVGARYELELVTSPGLETDGEPPAPAAAPGIIVAGRLCVPPGTTTFWVVVQVWRVAADGTRALVAVRPAHVFRTRR
jgi:hypothetical protein